MKTPLALALFIALSLSIRLAGQTFDDCSINGPLFVRVEEPARFNGSLQEYFQQELSGKTHDAGGLELRLLVNKTGKVCCMSISNNNTGIAAEEIKAIIGRMPDWVPAKQNNHFVDFAAQLRLEADNNTVKVDYTNGKVVIVRPVVNTNTKNRPEIVKDGSTTLWKLWNFNNSMVPSDLSRNVVMDNNGVIWYCTDRGIVKINKDQWEVYNGMNVPALSGKDHLTWTTGLAVDRSGNIWAKSFDYVVRFDGKEWTRYDTANSPLQSVSTIYADKAGSTWFCTYKGLIRFDGREWKIFSTANSAIGSDEVLGAYVDGKNTLWAATGKGISREADGHWSTLNRENSPLPDDHVYCITGDKHGNTWAAAGSGEKYYLVRIDPAGKMDIFPAAVVWKITVDDKEDKLWLATNGKGLASFDGRDFHYYDKTNSIIPSVTVSDILIDQHGDLWASTFGGLIFASGLK